METETSHCSSLSLPPPQNPDESYIGCFVTLISNFDLRYDGFIRDLSLQKWIIVLQNVRCHGTEGRGKNGFHIMPSNRVFEKIVFNGYHLKTVIYTDPRSMPYGSLNQTPIYNASNPQYVPYGSLNQAPIGNALESELISTQTDPSQSFFSNNYWSFPPVPFSIQPLNGAVASETAKKFNKYEIWGPSENKNQRDETVGNPFDPIERTYHPFGPIERPLDYPKEIHNYLQRNALLPGYNMTYL